MTVSDGLRQKCLELECSPLQVKTIYQGIETDLFYPGNRLKARRQLNLAEDHELILWVGRMVPIKGLELLVNAFARVHAKRPGTRLFLLGDGPSKADVQRQAQRLGISEAVCCVGAVGHDELPDWYRAADLCVLSSLSEGLPNVFREALACGTPFVSTDIGSIREIADPSYSVLVGSRNPDEFAAALTKALEPSFQAAAARYRPRTWEQCADEVREMFRAAQRTTITPEVKSPPQLSTC